MIAFTWLMRILVLALLLGGVVNVLQSHKQGTPSSSAGHF
ncbi:MAG: hypothetical protein JWQ02_1590 [Capsulimonas sp.]|jgi:hypothetical protein|nr:hypothetical protein [Capsulimonas sp.]